HTRFSRDWSSDVCSSDLRNVESIDDYVTLIGLFRAVAAHARPEGRAHDVTPSSWPQLLRRFYELALLALHEVVARGGGVREAPRSEERRVGKGCGGRGAR